jgi:hypothetical protein
MIWPFKEEPVAVYKLPMPDAIFRQEGQAWRYDPAQDITAYEVAMLIPMFSGRGFDGIAYLNKHNLIRHFTKIEE